MTSFRRSSALALFVASIACADDGAAPIDESSSTGGDTTMTPTTTTTTAPSSSTTHGGHPGSESGDTSVEEPPPAVDWPHVGCDPLVPSFCPLPFPSNVYSVADDATSTGRRVQLDDEAMPVDYYENHPDPSVWNTADGFTPGSQILAHFPGLLPAGLGDAPSSITIERSMEDDSPTVVLDAESGERIPHWVDLDMTGDDDEQRLFIIHPAIRLADDRRYIVSISGLTDADGNLLPATPGFGALRDLVASEEPSIEERRPLYADIFARLGDAGVARESIQLAWDFTTSSQNNQVGPLLHMRDEALEMVGDLGPEFEIVSVDTDYEPDTIAFRLMGEMTVPLYLDQVGPGASLIVGDDGLPEINPEMPTATFEFEVLIPHAATMAPAGIIQYGHGLLGDKEQIESEHFRTFMNEYNYVMFGVDFVGFASDDEAHVGGIIASGEFHRFKTVVDRQHQGMLNSLLAMRLMKGGFAADPTYGGYVDPERLYYHGISQGGIFGATYMALTTDVELGVLGVPGMPYNILLSRSVDFDTFFELIRATWLDARQHMFLLSLTDMLWETVEPAGFAPYVIDNRLPGTPEHRVFINAAKGDHQVTTLGAAVMARTMGMQHLDSGVRDIWGLEKVAGPIDGSGIVEYDFGLPEDPVGNLPQRECEDPHGKLRRLEEFRQQLDNFYRTGMIENFCADGVCSFADMSGCK